MNLLLITIICLSTPSLALSPMTFSPSSYEQAIKETWHNDEPSTTAPISMKQLIRYATLAPSGHNTQCWQFHILSERAVTIMPDLDRATPVVDPDDHHVYVSLGCAVENLVVAALAHGLEAHVDSSNPVDGIHVEFSPCPPRPSLRFDAIPNRRVTRADYDGTKLTNKELEKLRKATEGANGVSVLFLTDSDSIKRAQDYIIRANTIQINDKAFRQELKEWIRFSESECTGKGDGLMAPAFGNPFIPRFLGSKIFDWTAKAKAENQKIEKQIASSAGIAVFVSEHDDAAHWVEAGRVYERFALEATALSVKNAFLNQPVEVTEVRPQFAKAFGLNHGRPDLIVRFGKGGVDRPHSLRRPVEDVIVPAPSSAE